MIVILIENHYHYTISLAMLLWYLILHSHLQNQRPQILRISLEKGNIKLLWKVFDSRKISMFSSDISIDIDAGIRCFTSNINIDIFFKWTPLIQGEFLVSIMCVFCHCYQIFHSVRFLRKQLQFVITNPHQASLELVKF